MTLPYAGCKVMTITKPTSNGNQTITGVGFQPKVLILTAAKTAVQATIQTTFAAEYHGFATATEAMSVAACSVTTASGGPISASSMSATHAIHFISQTAGDLGKATVVSLDADGFTLNWSGVDANAYIINVMALSGTDLTNAKIMSFTKPTGAGPNDYTGFGFDPTAVVIAHCEAVTANPGTATNFYCASKGYCDSASNEWSFGTLEIGSGTGTSNSFRGGKTSNIWTYLNSIASFSYEGNVSAYITDGFRIATTTANGTAGKFIALCLRGLQTKAGIFNKSTNTSVPVAQAVTGVGFRPIGLIHVNHSFATANAGTTEVVINHGMADGTANLMNASGLRTSQAAVPGRNLTKDTVSAHCSNFSGTTLAEGATAFNADGFTVNWTTNDSLAYVMGYFAFGQTTPTGSALAHSQVVSVG